MLISHPEFASGRFTEPRVPTFLDTDTFETLDSSPVSRMLSWPALPETLAPPPGAAAGCPGRCATRCRRNCAAHTAEDAAPSVRSA